MKKTPKEQKKTPVWKKVAPCLYRYKDGVYYALVKRQGKQVRRSLKTQDRELANRRLRELQADLEVIDHEAERFTLEQFKEKFFETLTGSDSTLAKTKHAIGRLINEWPEGKPKDLDRIKTGHCQAWIASLKKESGKPLSSSTINEYITAADKFFALALNLGVIARNPMDGIKYRKRVKPIRATPTEEQFRAIVADIRSQKVNIHGADDSADYVELAGTLGLGQAELSGIRRQDIDLDAGIIRVFRQKTSQAFTIPIFPDARPIIERRLKDIPKEPEARLLPQDGCKKGLQGACRRLNLPHFSQRALRRFHITRSLRAGIDAPTVAAWQGHRDGGALVLKTYQAEVNLAHSLKMAAMLGPKPDNLVELPKAQAAG